MNNKYAFQYDAYRPLDDCMGGGASASIERGWHPGGLHARGVCMQGRSAFKGVCIQRGGCIGGGSYTCLNRKTHVKTLLCPKLHLRAVITKFLLCRNIFCVCIVWL